MGWVHVGQQTEIPIGEMQKYIADDIEVNVYHLEQGWYATAEWCTHQDCALSEEGEIDGDEIVCCCHGGAFNVETGAATRLPCVIPIETFPVRVVNGQIEVEID